MTNYRSLNHTKWACQYHVVFIPKYRKQGDLRGVAPGSRGGVAPVWRGSARARWKKGI